jgi:Domain of unknown function (DUF4326)
VNIMRPGPLGNHYVIGKDGSRDQVLHAYLRNVIWLVDKDIEFRLRVWSLWRRDLFCCCAPQRCHGHVLRWVCEAMNMGTWNVTVRRLPEEARRRKDVPLLRVVEELGLRWR